MLLLFLIDDDTCMAVCGIWLVDIDTAPAEATHLTLVNTCFHEQLGNIFGSANTELLVVLRCSGLAVGGSIDVDSKIVFIYGFCNLLDVHQLLLVDEGGGIDLEEEQNRGIQLNAGRCQRAGAIVFLAHSFLQTLKSFKIIFRELAGVIQKAGLIAVITQHFKNRLSVKALFANTDGNTQGCMKDIIAKMLVLAYAVKPLKGTGSTHLGCYMEAVGCSVVAKKTMTDGKWCAMNGVFLIAPAPK